MIGELEIRESAPGDMAGIVELYVEAFPDEDLVPLVRGLLALGREVISLVGIRENAIAGHISFTLCRVEEAAEKVALLAPLAVAPGLQKQGVGSELVRAGFAHLERAGIGSIFVLGDPGYYSRFGFRAEDKVATPYPLPADWRGAWQSLKLRDAKAPLAGRLSVPKPWRNAALWA